MNAKCTDIEMGRALSQTSNLQGNRHWKEVISIYNLKLPFGIIGWLLKLCINKGVQKEDKAGGAATEQDIESEGEPDYHFGTETQ